MTTGKINQVAEKSRETKGRRKNKIKKRPREREKRNKIWLLIWGK